MTDMGWTQYDSSAERQHFEQALQDAAADLYAALRKIVTELEGNDSHSHYRLTPEQLTVARAALAKVVA